MVVIVKQFLTILLIFVLLFGALLGLPLLIGIWLPDIISAPRHVLAEERLASGHSFRVIQYWNRGDFYNTELWHAFPNGTVETTVLDGDDNKSWSLPLNIDEQNKTATVTLSGNRVKRIDW
jgi:hypothetical protein